MTKKRYYLVMVYNKRFVMLNAHEKLTNRMCNSAIFENERDAGLDVNVFDYFNVGLTIMSGALDMRTKNAKELVKKYGYFSAQFLPNISKIKDGICHKNI